MAVTRGTLQIARNLRRDIGTEADTAVRTLTGEWVQAWDGLAAVWQVAAEQLTATAMRLGRWPRPVELLRMESVDRAMRASVTALGKLAERTETVAADGADRGIRLDAEREARIIASQAPDVEEPGLARMLADRLGVQQVEAMREAWTLREQARDDVRLTVVSRIRTDAIDVITRRTGEQIHSDVLPLADDAVDTMRRELVRGIDVGDNPRTTAARIVTLAQGGFNGGLTRAVNITRTEMLDAYRATSRQIHMANADVVPAWQWLSTLDRRVCPSCLSLHGTQYPASEPGPQDHQQGRCARLPVLATWAELGITAPEPPSAMRSAEAWFANLPRTAQLQIMGPARLQLLDDGRIGWGDLSTTRQSPRWRPSRVPTPVRDLRRRAETGATALAQTPLGRRIAAALARGQATPTERRRLHRAYWAAAAVTAAVTADDLDPDAQALLRDLETR